MLNVGIFGCTGRMGLELLKAVTLKEGMTISGGTCIDPDQEEVVVAIEGQSYSFPVLSSADELAKISDIIIDFTVADAMPKNIKACIAHNTAMVIGTTGFGDDIREQLTKASESIKIVQAGNMSLGVNLLAALVKKAASILGDDWDVEITEGHHRRKVDSPSGTALLFGEAAAEGRNIKLEDVQKLSREGHTGMRPAGEIGFSVIRAGSIVGDHSVLFGHDDEMITLSHRAQDRRIFANGAVYAAEKLVHMEKGLYDMIDILGLKNT